MQVEVKIFQKNFTFLFMDYKAVEDELAVLYNDGWKCKKYKIHVGSGEIRIVAILHRKINKLTQQS